MNNLFNIIPVTKTLFQIDRKYIESQNSTINIYNRQIFINNNLCKQTE